MTDEKRIAIGKRFIECHKNTKLSDWAGSHFVPEKAIYLRTYYNLISGLFGKIEFNDDEKFEIEIGIFESATGVSIIFEWEDDELEIKK